ncbi:MAG: DUF6785 family protein, partial [Planctomycetota bacterium]
GESHALRAAADQFGAADGLPYLLWREAAAAPSSPAPPAKPAVPTAGPAAPSKSPAAAPAAETLPDGLDALPTAPPQFAAFQAAFDQADAAAVEIFSPFADVVDDAKRYAQYTADQAAHPPVDLNRINRGAESTVACADSLAQAAADALARLAALRAGYTALAHMEKGASPSAGSAWRAVPWSEWLEPMAYWAAVMLAFHGLAFAFLLALRRAWVETERLPFPYTILPERVHQAIPGGIGGLGGQSGFGGQGGLGGNRPAERQSLFSRYWLYLPFLIGLALCLPSILGLSAKNILPPPPDPVDHPHDFSMAGWSIILNVDTWTLALILLFPLDLIFSVLFFFFVGAYAVPYLARMAGIEGFGQNLIPYQMLRMGGFLGLFLGTLWFNRAQMRELLTGRRSTPPSADSPDPVSPRIVTAVFYISLFALVLLLLHGEIGAGAQQVLLFAFGLFVILVYNFQEWRIRAAGGLPNWDFNNIMKVQSWSNWYFFGLHHTSPDPVTALPMPQQQLAWQQLYNTSLLGSYVPTLGPGAYFLEAFRIGDLFRARPRAILKAALLAFVFALLLGMPIYLLGIYHLGINAQPESGSWWNFAHQSDKIFRYYMKRSDGSP